MGLLGGLMGAGFHQVLRFVIHIRNDHNRLILLLPSGGLLTAGLYKVLDLEGNDYASQIMQFSKASVIQSHTDRSKPHS